jgi:pSer/pThr/pTyr-binding forkhead associated (FHA) protein
VSRIHLTIDRVALQGFDPAERNALIAGLRSELERALRSPGAGNAFQPRRTPVLRLPNVVRQSGTAGSRSLGSAVARAIGRTVKP